MEPYRPLVDWYIMEYLETCSEMSYQLTKEDKIALLEIPVMTVRMGDKSHPLMVAVQHTTAGLMQCYEGKKRKNSISHDCEPCRDI